MSKQFRQPQGSFYIWLTSASLALSLILLAGMLYLILFNGLAAFWPRQVAEIGLKDGSLVIGEIVEKEALPQADPRQYAVPAYRLKIKQGNRDACGQDFVWIDEKQIESTSYPAELSVIERLEWGNAYGRIESYPQVQELLEQSLSIREQITDIEKSKIASLNIKQEKTRLHLRKLELNQVSAPDKKRELLAKQDFLKQKYDSYESELFALRDKLNQSLVLTLADGTKLDIELAQVARIHQPNSMSLVERVLFYFSKIWEFLISDPREANTEGGIFPAIFGTVLMVMIMSLAVTPLGVLAAIYLREYAKQGFMVSLVRIAVNNLAGVPSIVFGVFGVGFFIYIVGGGIDRYFFPEALPAPTFGTGGILWASLTLALLTLPTVIVATEEGLASIPKHWREASYALGATRFETTWRVIIPALTPSILTGVILAIARAAGEVAPLMITGVVKLAPSLALDGHWPFLHLDRKFMHLGFHIYDLGFQSPNVDASRPLVYATTLLLIVLVICLNAVAILLRNKLQKKFSPSAI